MHCTEGKLLKDKLTVFIETLKSASVHRLKLKFSHLCILRSACVYNNSC